MKEEKNLGKMVFKDYYDSLSDVDKETVRNLILSESGMSYPTFYYKLRNGTFKPLELRLINKIINNLSKKQIPEASATFINEQFNEAGKMIADIKLENYACIK